MAWNDDPRVAKLLDALVAWADGMLEAQRRAKDAQERALAIETVAASAPRPSPYVPVRAHSFWPIGATGALVAMLEDGRTFALDGDGKEWRELPRLPVEVVESASFPVPFHA